MDDVCFPSWEYQSWFSVPPRYFRDDITDGLEVTSLVDYDHRARPYLQRYAHWQKIEATIRFYLRPSPLANEILADDPGTKLLNSLSHPRVSVHVRRGDNVTHPPGFHPLRSMQYYKDALKQLDGIGSVIVFSDDIPWCRTHLPDELERDLYFIEGKTRPREYADRALYDASEPMDWVNMQQMALYCDKHILSNSSYAWFAAFLSRDETPIYPSNWMGHHLTSYTDVSLMFPEKWIQVCDPTQEGLPC